MTRAPDADWRVDHQLWIEIFVLVNFLGLVADIYLAHSENAFRRSSEYIPLYFSAAAPLVLLAGVALRAREPAVWRDAGYLIGWIAVLIGLTGVILHLDSQFFHARTLRSLTYAAPFAAPLAYTGLGLLLLVNRMVEPDDIEWAQWVLLLAGGGFAGNFVFSLTDHAMNGFFNPVEWVPVVSSAFAVSFLLVPFLMEATRRFLVLCAAVLGVQALVGLIGFALHLRAVLRQPGPTLLERLLTGAPPMAPLLFPNLVVLALIGLWVLSRRLPMGTLGCPRLHTDSGRNQP
jgi:hypothetical protein